ncbi:hypothetical protein Trydic_g20251 [Trypoxylus dichotomus]
MESWPIFLFYLVVSFSTVCPACLPNEYQLPPPASGCVPYKGEGGKCIGDGGSLGLLTILLGGQLAQILRQLGLCHPTLHCSEPVPGRTFSILYLPYFAPSLSFATFVSPYFSVAIRQKQVSGNLLNRSSPVLLGDNARRCRPSEGRRYGCRAGRWSARRTSPREYRESGGMGSEGLDIARRGAGNAAVAGKDGAVKRESRWRKKKAAVAE